VEANLHASGHNLIGRFQSWLLLLLIPAAAYVAVSLVIFDWGRPARPFDDEGAIDREAVLGPSPRAWVISPRYAGMYYDGSEWPFVVYAPFCWAYQIWHGSAFRRSHG
jgi:hypothetical protein